MKLSSLLVICSAIHGIQLNTSNMHILDGNAGSENDVAEMVEHVKLEALNGKESLDDLSKMEDIISRTQNEINSDLSSDQADEMIANAMHDLEELEERDKLTKLQDTISRKVLNQAQVPEPEPIEQALDRVRHGEESLESSEVISAAQVLNDIELVNAKINKIQDIKSRASAVAQAAADADKSETARKAMADALEELQLSLKSEEADENASQSILSIEEHEATPLKDSKIGVTVNNMLAEEEEKVKQEAMTVEEDLDNEKHRDIVEEIAEKPSDEDPAKTSVDESIAHIVNSSEGIIEKINDLLKKANFEKNKLRELVQEIELIENQKRELIAESLTMFQMSDDEATEADELKEEANDSHAELTKELELLERDGHGPASLDELPPAHAVIEPHQNSIDEMENTIDDDEMKDTVDGEEMNETIDDDSMKETTKNVAKEKTESKLFDVFSFLRTEDDIGTTIRHNLNVSEKLSQDSQEHAKESMDMAQRSLEHIKHARELATKIDGKCDGALEIEQLTIHYLDAIKEEIDLSRDINITDRYSTQVDSIAESVTQFMSRIQEIRLDLPNEFSIIDKLELKLHTIISSETHSLKADDCAESHDASMEVKLHDLTGMPMHVIPHQCEEEACAEELHTDDCVDEDCIEKEEEKAPIIEETDPCDDALMKLAELKAQHS